MATTVLDMLIRARNQTTGVFQQIRAGFRGIGEEADGTKRRTLSLSDAIAFGMVKAQAATQLAQNGINFLKGKITEATDIQLQNISAATTFASLTGKSYDEASGFVDKFNVRISEAAASLPGSTAGYAQLARTIGDSVLPAFQNAQGQLENMQGYEDSLFNITEKYAALSAGSGVDIGNTSLGLTQALNGASIASLRQIQIFQNNPVLLGAIEDGLKQAGAKSLADLKIKDRVRIIEEAGAKVITEDFIEQASNSVSGLTESFKSSIFDPQTGLFGLFRDLNKTTEEQETAFAAFNEFLKTMVGSEGLLTVLGEILKDSGLPDPMMMLKRAFEIATDLVGQVTEIIYFFINSMESGRSFIDTLTAVFDVIDLELSPGAIGERLAEYVNMGFSYIFDTAYAYLSGLDYGPILYAFGQGVAALMMGVGSFLVSLDPGVYMSAGVAVAVVGVLIPFIVNAFISLGTWIALSFAAATAGLPLLLIAAAALVIVGLVLQIKNHWNEITTIMSEQWANFTAIFREGMELLKAVISGDFTEIQAAVIEFLEAIKTALRNPIDQLYEGVTGQASATRQKDMNEVEQRSLDLLNQAQMRAAERNAEATGGDAVAVVAEWAGGLPRVYSAAGGLLSAISQEVRRMPAGSDLAIANTSEFILTPQQMRNMMHGAAEVGSLQVSERLAAISGLTGGNAGSLQATDRVTGGDRVNMGGGGNVYQMTFNIPPQQNPEATARETLRFFEIFLREEMQARLT
ncbi:hypothetical protein H6F93_15555 [Leptolyngbya sp. FACHB-671]|uniref:hypothetical protein n=1 Tax=Leptolyngbya sp. FACHB-671 TaxID=2692812 RepID=UPI0016862DC8|nr:hypothetical protein [Leptolyngbya sp. FACHB-671]MBD2068920.1 hypothetical protein [Leptolyngbya sp. FACHB-671]